ncbi:hypothetical protein IT774_04965 [Salinimonas marina]|uniref:SMODS and SLOG-associating 2TM effector domain-containing protein n=1 Tax=Salinimonas marina TaxID=2785918 RepID=A0A7S9HEC6_9ALTE|nr:hypothetical protein [Salinimonas marina]QPG06526.1 hypothetical protein IT774_04965 [Salinimonas marina]
MFKWLHTWIKEPPVLENWISEETTKYRAKTIGLSFAVIVMELGAIKLEKVTWFRFESASFLDATTLLLIIAVYMLVNFQFSWNRDKATFLNKNNKTIIETIKEIQEEMRQDVASCYELLSDKKVTKVEPMMHKLADHQANVIHKNFNQTLAALQEANDVHSSLTNSSEKFSTFWLKAFPFATFFLALLNYLL